MPVKKRVTIYDIAKELGISTATVNRALTGKPRVSERTRELVLSKAEEMDFKPNTLARSLARKSIRLAVVAETGFPEFHGYFLDGARDAAADLEDFNTHVEYFNYEGGTANTPESDAYLETTLNRIARERYDGVLICAKQTAALETLKEYGVCVATAINDVERHLRKFCISYNGRIAGAIAAELMARLMPPGAKAAVASAVTGPGIHSQIVDGFLAQVKMIPLNLVDIFYHYDHEGISYEMTNALLERHPDLGGIYVNSFNSRGVIRSVVEHGLDGKVLLITSDISRELRNHIECGTVTASIFQNQFEQGREGLHMLYRAVSEGATMPDTTRIHPQIILRSNLELF
jgi:LacI family transcriptional regulator